MLNTSDGTAPIDRAHPEDLTIRAIGAGGGVRQCVGAVLLLASGRASDPDELKSVLAQRISSVPRLRQLLRRSPPGCGRPIWIDDPHFDPASHIELRQCPPPADEASILSLAAQYLAPPFPSAHPLWRAVVVTGLADNRMAVILVIHHLLADGQGALTVLGRLADPGPASSTFGPPQDPPSVRALWADAQLSRWPAFRRSFHRAPAMPSKSKDPRPARTWAQPCWLLGRPAPTYLARQLRTVTVQLAELHAAAHREGATINDALLAAVDAAVRAVLSRRGEHIGAVWITVPVGHLAAGTDVRLGNHIGLAMVPINAPEGVDGRLREISREVAAARHASLASEASVTFSSTFRILAGFGLYRLYLRHQRRFHTIVADLRGPTESMSIAGHLVESIIPLSVAELGNVRVSFVALSYAGRLVITITADPHVGDDLDVLARALQSELDRLVRVGACVNLRSPTAGRSGQ